MSALGLNGTRLLWRWRQFKLRRGESGVRGEIMWRSARAQHKMCRSCRALVPRSAGKCPECGASLADVATPGVGRLVTNLFPGITAVTSLLMLVNGFWFVMMVMAQIKAGGGGFGGFGTELLARFGAGVSRPAQLNGQWIGGEWWRWITPIFVHAGLLHFFFNSFLLIQLGPVVEELYGAQRFWIVYLSCGIGGSLTSQLPRFVISIGASGAIMGLIGLLLVAGYRSGGMLAQSMKRLTIRLIVYSLLLNLFFPIDHLAHIGGFATGALLALVVRTGPYRSSTERLVWQGLAFGGVALVLYAFFQVARHSPPAG